MYRHMIIAASLVALAVSTLPAAARHDTSGCQMDAAPGTVIEVGSLYINDRADILGTGVVAGEGTWIYEETNGIDDLQVGGTAPLGYEDPAAQDQETCDHAPDALIL